MISEINGINELNSSTSKPSDSIENNQTDISKAAPADPQVKATRTPKRKFTNGYKLKILTAYDACSSASERGALLRRESIYHSRISAWRNQLGMNESGKKTVSKAAHLAREIEQLKKKGWRKRRPSLISKKKSRSCLGRTSSHTTAARGTDGSYFTGRSK